MPASIAVLTAMTMTTMTTMTTGLVAAGAPTPDRHRQICLVGRGHRTAGVERQRRADRG